MYIQTVHNKYDKFLVLLKFIQNYLPLLAWRLIVNDWLVEMSTLVSSDVVDAVR